MDLEQVKMPYKEHYPLLPKYPYDTSKACTDLIAKAYANNLYKLPIVITRFANIFGPGQLNFSAIIPDGIRSALGYSKFTPRSDGSAIRDFIYADDVCDLYLKIAETVSKGNSDIFGEVFNAGTNDPISMYLNDIFTVPVNLAGIPAISIPAGQDNKGHPLGLQLITKALDEQKILNIAFAMEKGIAFKQSISRWWE